MPKPWHDNAAARLVVDFANTVTYGMWRTLSVPHRADTPCTVQGLSCSGLTVLVLLQDATVRHTARPITGARTWTARPADWEPSSCTSGHPVSEDAIEARAPVTNPKSLGYRGNGPALSRQG